MDEPLRSGSPSDRLLLEPYGERWSLLILRLWLGAMMIVHGWPKVSGDLSRFTEGVAKLGFPAPEFFAHLAAWTEFGGGILIALGLFTRPAALGTAIVMAVAAFGRHADDPFGKKELALTYLVISIIVLLSGPGRASLDALIAGRGYRRTS